MITAKFASVAAAALLIGAPAHSRLRSTPPSRPRAIFRDCLGCPQMVTGPAGSFNMGAPVSEPDSADMERPVPRVKGRAFPLGPNDVTRDEFAEFVRATRRPMPKGCFYSGRPGPTFDRIASWSSLGFSQTARDPAVCVTWTDAHDYAAWLSHRTGRHYRLPAEAEWEYAARAGSATTYYWGDRVDRRNVNYGLEKGWGAGLAVGRDRWVNTSPGGAFPPNHFGLYDMSGNVLQMVEDCLSASYAATPTDGSAYTANVPLHLTGDLADLAGQPSCEFRMLRGGDWGDPPGQLRSAFRIFLPGPTSTLGPYRSGGVGFRVARDLSQ